MKSESSCNILGMELKYPKLMEKNNLSISIEGDRNGSYVLFNAKCWPNRGEIKQVGSAPKFYLYASDGTVLLETTTLPHKLPDIFGLRFKRVISTHVDFKTKIQAISAIMIPLDIINNMETMHEQYNYDN